MMGLLGRVGRSLLRILPADFRERFGEDIAHHISARTSEIRERRGWTGVLRFWVKAITDVLAVAAAEHACRGRGGIPALRSALASINAARQAAAQDAADTADLKQVQTLKRNSITSPSWAT